MQYKIIKKINVSDLCKALSLEYTGNGSCIIESVGSLFSSDTNALKFSKKIPDEHIYGVLISFIGSHADSLIISENPRLDYCRALNYLISYKYLVKCEEKSCIAPTAIIANSVVIENGVYIGDGTLIEPNVTLHQGTIIGSNSIIRANSVIGAQGFGFEKSLDGKWIRFPHLGRVIIGNNVEIGALNSVCIGALDNTIISDGVKTDNLVHIAHNCQIGKNSILTACTELSGGVILGEGVWMGPNSSIMQKITINNFATVGLGSVVTKNVESGHTVAGVPARIIKR